MFKQSLSNLNRVGQTLAGRLKKLNLVTTLDLIYYFPFRYEDFSQITPIKDLQPDQQTTISGKLEIINNRRSWRRKMMITEAVIRDQTEAIKIIWFNQPYIAKIIKPGDNIFISGKVSADETGFCFKNPIYEKTKTETTHTARIIPLYPLTEGITQKQIRFLMSQVTHQANQLGDWLPEKIITNYKLIALSEALEQIHFPKNWQMLRAAQRRLGFDEIITVQLHNLQIKKELKNKKSYPIKFSQKQIKSFVANLPFTLTAAQKKSAWQIIKDLEKSKPMNRLLMGDVGSGKTVIAAIAMLNAAIAGYSSLLMAPTEILAQQHFQTIEKIIGEKSVSLITRTKKKIIKNQKIIVGTQALIQKNIKFDKLALVIVDEQHRFGVSQRKLLHDKSNDSDIIPHLLSMTATPIPRTLALTVYGDLDISLLNELPKGRKKITTKLVSEDKRGKAYEFIRQKIKQGEQAFVICPLISESDKLGIKSVEQEYEKIKTQIFPDLRVAKLHGKLKEKNKDEVMQDFKNKKYDILISTSIIEVGVDIPNATIMMIEGADCFGLAQLHQFRGRVGRSTKQSYCLLFSDSGAIKTRKRLETLVNCQDGFKLAEADLKLRGPGAIYGTQQSGFLSTFKIATLTDQILISEAKEAAIKIIENISQYPLVEKKLKKFQDIIHME